MKIQIMSLYGNTPVTARAPARRYALKLLFLADLMTKCGPARGSDGKPMPIASYEVIKRLHEKARQHAAA